MLKALPGLAGVAIGSRGLYKNPASVLIDFSDIDALLSVLPRSEEIVFASKRLAVVRSALSAEAWSDLLTGLQTQFAGSAVDKVRYRPSQGGRIIAKPQVLEQSARSTRAQLAATQVSAAERDRRASFACLRFQGLAPQGRDCVAKQIAAAVADKAGLVLAPHELQTPMPDSTFAIGRNLAGQWNGSLLIQASCQADVQKIMKAVHGNGVEIDGACYTAEVDSDFVLPTSLLGQ